MTMLRRTAVVSAVTVAASAVAVAASPSAHAVQFKLTSTAHVSTYVAKMKKTISFPEAPSTATVDSDTRTLVATLQLPDSTTPNTGPLGATLGYVTMRSVPVEDTQGKIAVDGTVWHITAAQKFHIKIVKLTGVAKLVNYVPPTCQTSTPVTATLTGSLDFSKTGPGSWKDYTLTGPYTIPQFTGCGLLTPAINSMVAGPGNTLNARFTS